MFMPNMSFVYLCLLRTVTNLARNYVHYFLFLLWYQMFKTDDWAPLSAFNIFFTAFITLYPVLKSIATERFMVMPSCPFYVV